MSKSANLYTYVSDCYVVVNEYGGILPDSEFDSEASCLQSFIERHDGKTPSDFGCVIARVQPVAVSGDKNHRLFRK